MWLVLVWECKEMGDQVHMRDVCALQCMCVYACLRVCVSWVCVVRVARACVRAVRACMHLYMHACVHSCMYRRKGVLCVCVGERTECGRLLKSS